MSDGKDRRQLIEEQLDRSKAMLYCRSCSLALSSGCHHGYLEVVSNLVQLLGEDIYYSAIAAENGGSS